MLVLQALLVVVLSLVGVAVIYAATRGVRNAFESTRKDIQAEFKKLQDTLQRIGATPESPPDNSRILTVEAAIQRGISQNVTDEPDVTSAFPEEILSRMRQEEREHSSDDWTEVDPVLVDLYPLAEEGFLGALTGKPSVPKLQEDPPPPTEPKPEPPSVWERILKEDT